MEYEAPKIEAVSTPQPEFYKGDGDGCCNDKCIIIG